MAKKNVPLSSLGSQHVKDNLRRFYPFLRKEFRIVKETELGNEKVFKELFGDEAEVNLEYIRAIFKYQQCDIKTREASTSTPSEDSVQK